MEGVPEKKNKNSDHSFHRILCNKTITFITVYPIGECSSCAK
jgi:hypothetical protein